VNKNSDILIKFGKRVQAMRIDRGITSQMELANKAGLDRTYIGGVERGERNIALKNIAKIAKVLNVSPSELLKF
jgi:transcriptional regulator with XRE-family HTH domain